MTDDPDRPRRAGRAWPSAGERAPRPPDYAALAAALATALRTAGLPVGPDRSERLAGALTVMRATTIGQLHACALATMVSAPSQIDAFERVFNEMFGAGPGGPRRPQVTAPQQNMIVESAERADGAEEEESRRGGRRTSCRPSSPGSTRHWPRATAASGPPTRTRKKATPTRPCPPCGGSRR